MPQDAVPPVTRHVQGCQVLGWQPVTFPERGVAAPFTTPHLAGARLRRGARGALELILPDVCGPGSVGILGWDRVGSLCSPSLFDRRLGTRLAALPALTPAALRAAVIAEAAGGLAGPEAQEAAQAAQAADAGEQARAAAELRQVGLEHAGLAALLAPLGLGAEADAARLPRLGAAVADLAAQVTERGAASPEDADWVAAAARHAAAAALPPLLAARALAADPAALLRRLRAAPDGVTAELQRADWVLDGWAWLCRLWAGQAEARDVPAAALAELAALVPPAPREAGAPPGAATRRDLPDTLRTVLRGGDWRSGVTAQDMVARNERLLAAVLTP